MSGRVGPVDLHTHSHYSSDGQYPPAFIVAAAEGLGLAAVALTDHDEVGGLEEFVAAARGRKVEAVPGVELTCDCDDRWVHILGYFIVWESPPITNVIARGRQARWEQAAGRLRLLAELGIRVDEGKLRVAARGHPPVGPIIGMVALTDPRNDGHPLLEDFRRPPKNAMPYFHFDRDMLSHGKPAYFPVKRITPAEAVAAIREAGGAAVFAHPGDRFDVDRDRALFEGLARAGLTGLECYCSYHDAPKEQAFAALAKELGVVATAGSDFHGPRVKPLVSLGGVSVSSYAMVEELRARARRE